MYNQQLFTFAIASVPGKDQAGLKVKVHIREGDFSLVTSGSITVQLQVPYGSPAFTLQTETHLKKLSMTERRSENPAQGVNHSARQKSLYPVVAETQVKQN